ncbi:uncharacterized protein [Lepeophtheirus salmonis]|uniref:Protoncoupled amino acid transporter 1like [Amphimedon queenslandica] n=2 Tax=Lepeophtheirus salmonis TaxID=72036 RepID=A0A0K2UUY9_LEPSM|nr:amino acid transporter AVT3A-like [Lepeophtheirus salmonis]XP_040571496.1 amino acid transporter AVT3A-like [Lepeophtheirus salmonis]
MGHKVKADPGGEGGDPRIRIVSNIFISFLGAGVLGLPYAFKESGLLEGAIVMTFVSIISVKAMLLIVDAKYLILAGRKRAQELPLLKNEDSVEDGLIKEVINDEISYSDVGDAAFGHAGRLTIDTALLVSQLGFCCAYLIFISETLSSYFTVISKTQCLFLMLPPLFGLTLIKDLSQLAPFSLIGQIFNFLAFAVVFWFDFDHLHLAANQHRKEFSLSGFPFFFAVAIYCFEGAGMILSLENSVDDGYKPNFKKTFIKTIAVVTFIYISFGASGYLSYGHETKDIITLNLPHVDGTIDFATLVKVCLCFSLFCTYPVMIFPVSELLEKKFLVSSSSSPVSGLLIRGGIVTMTGVVVKVVPRFADLMALIGASCCTLLAFIIPASCHLKLFSKEITKKQIMIDYLIFGIGIIGAILGTTDALKKVISS